MFDRFKKKMAAAPPDSGNVSPVQNPDRVRQAASTLAHEKASGNRCRFFAVGILVVVFGQTVAIMQMLPLKERVPYFIDVETSTGRVTIADRVAHEFKPHDLNIKYHLKTWAENLYTLDSALTQKHLLPAAAVMLRGKARDQYRTWLDEERPIERLQDSPPPYRSAEVISINFLTADDRVALIRIRAKERNGSLLKESQYSITAHYVIAPPVSEEEAYKNPIGLYVTEFNVSKEAV